MNELVTRGMLKEELTKFRLELRNELTEIFSQLESRIMARMEFGFAELNDRLDSEQAFTSDMWDDFSARLAGLEAK